MQSAPQSLLGGDTPSPRVGVAASDATISVRVSSVAA